jgi:two-component system, cell cycle response regulator DivK
MPDSNIIPNFDWNNKVILIAEDEDSNFRYLEMVLLRTGVKIVWAKDGLQAIEFARSSSPDLILMDIKMPIMDGLEATREIKKFLPSVPVVAQTAYAMENDERISLEAGCDYFITKPIRKQKLLEVVNKFLK